MNDLAPALAVLSEADQTAIVQLADELRDAWGKRQVFRTDTEMRVSVLNDGAFPTPASKYWQCVREQTVMLDNLVSVSFEMRRNAILLQRLQARIDAATDPLDNAEAQVDMDEAMWSQATMEQQARDRVREIQHWSAIKAELNDGSFDVANVNAHQVEAIRLQLLNRANTFTAATAPQDVLNVHGMLHTMDRLADAGTLVAPQPRLAVSA